MHFPKCQTVPLKLCKDLLTKSCFVGHAADAEEHHHSFGAVTDLSPVFTLFWCPLTSEGNN